MGAKIVPQLIRYPLEFNKTLSYLEDNLQGTNALSTAILHNAQLNEGEFFTLLYKEVTFEQLYDFTSGGVGGSIKDRISYIVLEEFQNNPELTCIFDDTGATYIDPYNDPLFLKTGIHYRDEVYYWVNHKNLSKALIDTCFFASEATWHSLCVLTNVAITFPKDRSVNEPDILQIAQKAFHIIVSAYDAESYIFWRKKSLRQTP